MGSERTASMATTTAPGFKPVGNKQTLLISGSPHNSLATTNLIYLYADVAASLGIANGSFVQIAEFVWQVGCIDPDVMRQKATRENWLPKFEKHLLESKRTVVLNGMHRDCLGLKNAADWAGLEMDFTPVEVLPQAAAGSFTIEVSQFPYRPQNPKKKFENSELDAIIKSSYRTHVFKSGQRFFLEKSPGEYLACAVTDVELMTDMAAGDKDSNAIAQ